MLKQVQHDEWEVSMAKIGIIGSEGRMGLALAEAIVAAGHECSGGVDKGGDASNLAAGSDALVDFSAPVALQDNLKAASAAGIPMLVGTTGLDDMHFAAIEEAAQTIPVLQTGNTSLGVTLLAHLVEEAASKLGSDWDIEIVEMHHRMKVDAPSGTALLLGQAAAKGRGHSLVANMESGRHGHTGKRSAGAIGFAALRGGTIAGEHSVYLAGEQERIQLTHLAENRSIFANGAVKGASWLIGKEPGRYAMTDVLGL